MKNLLFFLFKRVKNKTLHGQCFRKRPAIGSFFYLLKVLAQNSFKQVMPALDSLHLNFIHCINCVVYKQDEE